MQAEYIHSSLPVAFGSVHNSSVQALWHECWLSAAGMFSADVLLHQSV